MDFLNNTTAIITAAEAKVNAFQETTRLIRELEGIPILIRSMGALWLHRN